MEIGGKATHTRFTFDLQLTAGVKKSICGMRLPIIAFETHPFSVPAMLHSSLISIQKYRLFVTSFVGRRKNGCGSPTNPDGETFLLFLFANN